MNLDQLKEMVADYQQAATVTDFTITASPNLHSNKPTTYDGEFRIEGTPSVFNRIFADVVNDFKEQILKEVGKRAKAEGSAKKAEYKNTIDSLKAEVDKL